MPPQELLPSDIPPPPEAERLAKLKQRREELEQKLADEKVALKRMQADRRALLRKQIKQAKSRLTKSERKRRTQRLIQMGLLLESRTEADPEEHARMLKDLDGRLERKELRDLFGLPPLGPPVAPAPASSTPTGSRDNPLPGWHPYRIPGTKEWLAEFEGDTSALPDDLVGLRIIITSKAGKTWVATVLEVIERSKSVVRVRTSGKP